MLLATHRRGAFSPKASSNQIAATLEDIAERLQPERFRVTSAKSLIDMFVSTATKSKAKKTRWQSLGSSLVESVQVYYEEETVVESQGADVTAKSLGALVAKWVVAVAP